MDQTSSILLSQTNLYGICDILSKPFSERSNTENDYMATILSNMRYLKQHIADSEERKDFCLRMSQYLKYNHFPRGTLICHQNDPEIDFGIVILGCAFMYDLQEPVNKELGSYEKAQKFFQYKKRIEDKDFPKKLRKWLSLRNIWNNVDPPNLSGPDSSSPPSKFSQLYKAAVENLEIVLEQIIGPKQGSEQFLYQEDDYDLEEKLLILHHDGLIHNYFTNATATHKKIREFKSGDAITEISLLTGNAIQNTIIASEDLHILKISHLDFFSLFQIKTGNIAEKKQFLSAMFPELFLGMIVKLSAGIQEKTFMIRDIVYEEGQEPDSIYILRTGGVQVKKLFKLNKNYINKLLTLGKREKSEKVPYLLNLKDAPQKGVIGPKKLMIGEIGPGGIFGEEEVINDKKRKYFAVCTKTPTQVYLLPKEIYYEVFKKHFPQVSQVFKIGMRYKVEWRQERLNKGIKVINEVLKSVQKKDKIKVLIKDSTQKAEPEIQFQIMNSKVSKDSSKCHPPRSIMGLEERNSRNTNNRVEIRTLSSDRQFKKDNEPSKLNKLQQQYIKRSLSSVENKLSIVADKTNQLKTQEVKLNLWGKNHERRSSYIVSPSITPRINYRTSAPNSPISTRSPNSPSSPKSPLSPNSYFFGNSQPQTFDFALNYPNQPTLKSEIEKNQEIHLEKNPYFNKTERTCSPELIAMTSIAHNRKDSYGPVSLGCSPRGVVLEPNTFSDEVKNVLTSKTSRFYQRIISSHSPNKKKTSDLLQNMTPIDVKTFSKHQIVSDPNKSDVSKCNIALYSPQSLINLHPSDDVGPKSPNSNRFKTVSVSIPKIHTKNFRNYDFGSFFPSQKVYVLNRGLNDPQIVLVDPDIPKKMKE